MCSTNSDREVKCIDPDQKQSDQSMRCLRMSTQYVHYVRSETIRVRIFRVRKSNLYKYAPDLSESYRYMSALTYPN